MQGEDYGKITQVYTVAPDLLSDAVYEANAQFVGRHNAVLYGSASGYLFALDRTSAKVLYGLDHSEGVYPDKLTQLANSHREGCVVQAIGVSARNYLTHRNRTDSWRQTYRRNSVISEGCVVTGSRDGKLSWWTEPGGFTCESVRSV